MPEYSDHDSSDSNASGSDSNAGDGSGPQMASSDRQHEESIADRMMEPAINAMDSFGMGPLRLNLDTRSGKADLTLNITTGQILGLGKLLNDLNLTKLLRDFDLGPFEIGVSIQEAPSKTGGYCGSYFFGVGGGIPLAFGISSGLELSTCGTVSLTQIKRLSIGSVSFPVQQHEITRSDWNRTLSALAEDHPPRW